MMEIEKILPVWKVEEDCMVSMSGDVTIAFKVMLPETGTLSSSAFDAAQQAFVKAIRILPSGVVFHKADWFFKSKVKVDFESSSSSVLAFASDGHFNERPYLDHECFLFLTLLPRGRKLSSSAYCNILRKSIAPVERRDEVLLKNFFSAVGSFERILSDSGLFSLVRLLDEDLAGTANHPGIIERYLFLLGKGESSVLRDVHLRDEIRVGDKKVQLFSLADAQDLPGICGSRIDFDAYSTDRTKYSIGFSSPLGLFLDCNHIYNQLIFTGDPQRTIKELEAKKLRLQSLSAYSRENAVSRDFVMIF